MVVRSVLMKPNRARIVRRVVKADLAEAAVTGETALPSSIGTSMMRLAERATMRPNRPAVIRSTAATPNRVARMRSKTVRSECAIIGYRSRHTIALFFPKPLLSKRIGFWV